MVCGSGCHPPTRKLAITLRLTVALYFCLLPATVPRAVRACTTLTLLATTGVPGTLVVSTHRNSSSTASTTTNWAATTAAAVSPYGAVSQNRSERSERVGLIFLGLMPEESIRRSRRIFFKIELLCLLCKKY